MKFSSLSDLCLKCPHVEACKAHTGRRLLKIPVSQAQYRLIPPAFKPDYIEEGIFDDPDIPHIRQLYKDCYITVFSKPPSTLDPVHLVAPKVVDAARRSNCSLRLYMLTNMVGHKIQQDTVVDATEKLRGSKFTSKLLVGKVAEQRVDLYADMCRNEFGTFNVGSLSALTEEDWERNSLEYRMFTSEMAAGQFLVDWKITNGGPVFEELYINKELSLDPAWLATESTYRKYVLDPYLKSKHGTDALKQHRFNVVQSINAYKKHRDSAIIAFRCRELVMKRAVEEVLRLFGYNPDDFEIEDKPVTDTITLWTWLGRAIQHHHCLRFLRHEPSVFSR